MVGLTGVMGFIFSIEEGDETVGGETIGGVKERLGRSEVGGRKGADWDMAESTRTNPDRFTNL